MGTRLLWDPIEDNIVRELDDSNTTVADYTTEPYLYGDLISQDRDGQSRFYHFDGRGSTTELTDSSGVVTDTRRYSAFGETTVSTGSTDFPLQFVGQYGYYCDQGTGEIFARRRIYEPAIARWSAMGPIRIHAVGLNTYAYLGNAPLAGGHDSSESGGSVGMPAPTSRNTCLVGLDCTNMASGVFHCGVAISYYADDGTLVKEYLHSKGYYHPVSRDYGCHVVTYSRQQDDAKYEILYTNEWPKKTCDCIRATALTINAKIGAKNYKPFVNNSCFNSTPEGGRSNANCNSNYIAKCLLRNCGVNFVPKHGSSLKGVPGWSHRMWHCTVKYTYRTCDQLCCRCSLWEADDVAWCGAPQTPPSKDPLCFIAL
jgi:RHS repeat-associated protein